MSAQEKKLTFMMMEDGREAATPGSLFGSYPSFGGGIGRTGSLTGLSPYLNVDPSYLQTQVPEFIRNEETKRGNMENSFTAIGSSVLLGGTIGGAYGLYDGIRLTAVSQMKGKLRRTQILNHTLKSGERCLVKSIWPDLTIRVLGANSSLVYTYSYPNNEEKVHVCFILLGGSVSNALGSIAVVYSSLYILMSQVYEEDNEAKTCVTGAATGNSNNANENDDEKQPYSDLILGWARS